MKKIVSITIVVLVSWKKHDNNVFACILYIFSIIDLYQKGVRAVITREAKERRVQKIMKVLILEFNSKNHEICLEW